MISFRNNSLNFVNKYLTDLAFKLLLISFCFRLIEFLVEGFKNESNIRNLQIQTLQYIYLTSVKGES